MPTGYRSRSAYPPAGLAKLGSVTVSPGYGFNGAVPWFCLACAWYSSSNFGMSALPAVCLLSCVIIGFRSGSTGKLSLSSGHFNSVGNLKSL